MQSFAEYEVGEISSGLGRRPQRRGGARPRMSEEEAVRFCSTLLRLSSAPTLDIFRAAMLKRRGWSFVFLLAVLVVFNLLTAGPRRLARAAPDSRAVFPPAFSTTRPVPRSTGGEPPR